MAANPAVREKKIQQVILIEGTANAVVLVAKTIVGYTTGSLAVIGDALHSLTDVANNIRAAGFGDGSDLVGDK